MIDSTMMAIESRRRVLGDRVGGAPQVEARGRQTVEVALGGRASGRIPVEGDHAVVLEALGRIATSQQIEVWPPEEFDGGSA